MACPTLEDILDEDSRFAMMIDGANLYQTARALDFDIDYRLLLQVCARTARLVRASYYTALLDGEEYSPLRPLVDWLGYNGYSVVTKPMKEIADPNGRRRYKGNMNVELAIDAIEMAPTLDHLLLFSGDGTFRRLIEAVQRKGVRVTAVSTLQTQPPMIADELRRQADSFIELQELAPWIGRERRATAMPGRESAARSGVNPDLTEV
ncbi:MAG: NYN domain-containing protein [Geminicoccales bacterium]